MVEIRRAPLRKNIKLSSSSSSSSLLSACSIRNVILLVIGLQVVSIVWKVVVPSSSVVASYSEPTKPIPDRPPQPSPPLRPLGLQDRLKESIGQVPKTDGNHNHQQQHHHHQQEQQQQQQQQQRLSPPKQDIVRYEEKHEDMNAEHDGDEPNLPHEDVDEQEEPEVAAAAAAARDRRNGARIDEEKEGGMPEEIEGKDEKEEGEEGREEDEDEDLGHVKDSIQQQNRQQKQQNPLLKPIPGSAKHNTVLQKQGSGPTTLAYIKDFDDERSKPAFRTVEIANDPELPSKVASLVGETSLKPCEVYQGKKRVLNPKCTDPDTPLIVYNAARFARTWCGTHIEPKMASKLEDHCPPEEPVHLFPTDFAPVSGQGMSPIILKSHDDTPFPGDLETLKCDIPCQQEKGMAGEKRYIDGEPWTLTYTMADSWTSSTAKIERTDFRRDHYYATQSWKSSVPLTVFHFDKYNLRNRPPVAWDSVKSKAIYLVNSSCSSQGSRRNKYFHATAAKYPVDAYGTCHHNVEVPAGMTIDTPEGRIELMKQYKFVLAFDSMTEKDHISDLMWEALLSGAVPVMVGADNMRDHLPRNSFIWAGDYQSWDDMAAYIKTVSDDKALWESYHKWRTDEGALKAFEDKYYFTKTNPLCRVCRWAYAKRYGLGWDHGRQEVKEPKIARKLCVGSSKGMVTKPFQEAWLVRSDRVDTFQEGKGASETCNSISVDKEIDMDSYKMNRAIHQHDSIVDIILTRVEKRKGTKDELVLSMKFPHVRNSDGSIFHNPHILVESRRGPLVTSAVIQDNDVKVTVLADWVTSITSPQEGVIEVIIQKSEDDTTPGGDLKRIRVITEDTSKLHDKMTEFFPSSFGGILMQDFVDPMDLFYADA